MSTLFGNMKFTTIIFVVRNVCLQIISDIVLQCVTFLDKNLHVLRTYDVPHVFGFTITLDYFTHEKNNNLKHISEESHYKWDNTPRIEDRHLSRDIYDNAENYPDKFDKQKRYR